MKPIHQFLNEDKAKLLHELFPGAIPSLLNCMVEVADLIEKDKEKLAENWNNPFMSVTDWYYLSSEIKKIIAKKRDSLCRSSKQFSELLFNSYLALFSCHCIVVFGKREGTNPKLTKAIDLLFNP